MNEFWVKTLWDTLNAITGFAILQGIAFGYILGKGEIAASIQTCASRLIITLIAVMTLTLYCSAIYVLTRHGSTLIESQHKAMWWRITYLRWLVVGFFVVIPLLGLWM